MLLYIAKVVVMFVIAIAVLRLMGKTIIAQVRPHDLMAIVMIAALAVHPILDDSFWRMLIAIVTVVLLHLTFAKLALYKSMTEWMLGEPTIIVKHGKIVKENLRRNDVSLSELLSAIRSRGYPSIRDVQYAILEPTGSISVLPKEDLYPATPRDLKLDIPYRGLPLSLVVDGRIQTDNLKLIGKTSTWLSDELKKRGYGNIREVMYAAALEHEPELIIDDGEGNENHP